MSELIRKIVHGLVMAVTTIVVTAIAGEVALRIKNSDQQSYNIEMWRYARELKEISPNPLLGHVHKKQSRATLQNVDFAINSLGMRGPEPDLGSGKKKVLLLGSSITLGWGVAADKTLRARMQNYLGDGYEVLNGGVGNYNTARSINQFKEGWRDRVKPDVVVVHYFVNDAEYLPPSEKNLILGNSQLAVTLYFLAQNWVKGTAGVGSIVDHYKQVYQPDARGYQEMQAGLADLKRISEEDGFQVIFSMIPDIHQLQDYPFDFIHARMAELSAGLGWTYVDFNSDLDTFEGPELWTIPGDPHPNAKVHDLMARRLADVITR